MPDRKLTPTEELLLKLCKELEKTVQEPVTTRRFSEVQMLGREIQYAAFKLERTPNDLQAS